MSCEHRIDEHEHVGLCWGCRKGLFRNLYTLDELIDELHTSITKQSVHAKSPGKSSGEAPLPFDMHASQILDLILDTLRRWALIHPGVDKYRQAHGLVASIRNDIGVISTGESADRVVKDIDFLIDKARKAIDTPQLLVPLGKCGCSRDLYASPTADLKVCQCGMVFDVPKTRARYQSFAREQLVSAKDAEALGELWGKVVKRKTVLAWSKNGKLDEKGLNSRGEKVFRFGDVLELARERVVKESQLGDSE